MSGLQNLQQIINQGEIAVGTYITLGNGMTTEILGHAGFDFLWIDMEHTVIDKESLLSHLIAAKSAGKCAFVRIAWNDPVLAKPVLDMGVDAIIFPMINSGEEARKAIAACMYPPDGNRGYGPTRANMYGLTPTREYIEGSSSSFWKILQIEHIDAVRCLDEILDTNGVDSVLIGPSDLSASVGMLQELARPEMKQIFDEIAVKLNARKIPFGVAIGYDEEAIKEWKDRGISWIAVESDGGLLAKGARATVEDVNRIFSQSKL